MLRSIRTLSLAALAAGGLAVAQENTTTTTTRQETNEQPRQDDNTARQDRRVTGTNIVTPAENDRRIARWLLCDCEAIHGCSQDAKDRLTNEEVKNFAAMMVEHHAKSCAMLKEKRGNVMDKASGYLPNRNPANAEARNDAAAPATQDAPQDRPAADKPTAVVIRREDAGTGNRMMYVPADFLRVKEDVCKHMSTVMKSQWKDASGPEFDKAYIAHMVCAHEMALASVKACRATASSEFASELDKGTETLKEHLAKAKELCDKHRTKKDGEKVGAKKPVAKPAKLVAAR